MFRQKQEISVPSQDLTSFVFDGFTGDIGRPVYVDSQRPSRLYSVRTAKMTIRRLVAGLRFHGFRRGDTVLVNSAGDIDYSIAFLGIIAAGGIFTGSNPAYTAHDLTNQLRKTRTKFILTQSQYLAQITTAARECGIPERNIFVFNHGPERIPSGFHSWERLLDHGEDAWVTFEDANRASSTVAAYVMSSGTTGSPKACAISHANVLAEITLGYEPEPKDFNVRRLLSLPQFATAAMYTNHVCPIRRNETAYVMPRFVVKDFVENCEKFQITELSVVPPMVIALLQSGLASRERFRSIKLAHGGAAPLSKDLQARFKALLPEDTPFTQIWGMTETSGLATSFFYPEKDDTGSIGRLISNTDVKLVDDDDKDISAFDIRGELCIRGPTVIRGYESSAIHQPFLDEEGYFHTGDICYCDSKTRKWYIVDRKKDLIKVKAFQVAPAELEAVLLAHPAVNDAAVIGIPRPEEGTELPRAYVVRAPGSEIKAVELENYVAERVSSHNRLTGGVVFLDSIEKAASGKILKTKLRAMAERKSHL